MFTKNQPVYRITLHQQCNGIQLWQHVHTHPSKGSTFHVARSARSAGNTSCSQQDGSCCRPKALLTGCAGHEIRSITRTCDSRLPKVSQRVDQIRGRTPKRAICPDLCETKLGTRVHTTVGAKMGNKPRQKIPTTHTPQRHMNRNNHPSFDQTFTQPYTHSFELRACFR